MANRSDFEKTEKYADQFIQLLPAFRKRLGCLNWLEKTTGLRP